MIKGIHHVSLQTANFDRQIEFYREAFGFEKAGDEIYVEDKLVLEQISGIREGSMRAAILKAGNCFMEVIEWIHPKGRTGTQLDPNDHGYTHFCIDVTDIDAEYVRLKSLGVEFVHPSPVTVGSVKTVYGRDPDGNLLEIQEVTDDSILNLKAASLSGSN